MHRPYPLKISLVVTPEVEKTILIDLQDEHPAIALFFSMPRLGMDDNDYLPVNGLTGQSPDFEHPLATGRFWKTFNMSQIDFYKEKVVPILYPFLAGMDNEESFYRKHRYLFVEIGLTRNSLLMKGDLHDNNVMVALKTLISPFENTAN